jgi:predicted DCC family thiol-disulfide oxidoreductase YuxK
MNDSRSKTDPAETQIIYDGACPLCSAYIRNTAFKSTESVRYIDARQCPELVRQFCQQGIDLDEGLVVRSGNAIHHGADAMHVLTTMTKRRGFLNRMVATLFATQNTSRFVYPFFRTGRNLLLRLLRRPPLHEGAVTKTPLKTTMLYWAPIALLLLMLANHMYLRHEANLSPWLGAGFGMFSTTDSVSARQLVIYGIDGNGLETELTVPHGLIAELKRTSALPTTSSFTQFTEKMHGHLLQSDCDATAGCAFSAYRLEIWRAHYDPQTLLPVGERLKSAIVKAPVHERS